MKNKFTDYLTANGWRQVESMNYKLNDFQILFDTSNQIDLYADNVRLEGLYCSSVDELDIFLKPGLCIRNLLQNLIIWF